MGLPDKFKFRSTIKRFSDTIATATRVDDHYEVVFFFDEDK